VPTILAEVKLVGTLRSAHPTILSLIYYATAPAADRSAARAIYPFPAPHLAARFSANDASPSDASRVCRRLACIRTSRA
jgi:hypothetical protein